MNINDIMFEHLEKEYDVKNEKVTVGMKLSGGCDSAIVYYTLCKKYEKNDNVNIVVLSLDTSRKRFYSRYAKRVVDIVGKMTGKYPVEHMIKYIEHWPDGGDSSPYSLGQDELFNKAKEKYGIEYCYSGLTKNPDIDDMIEYFEKNHEKHGLDLELILKAIRKRDSGRDQNIGGINDGFRPFGNSDKLAVSAQYRYYENLGIPLLDELFHNTDSCESHDRHLKQVPINVKTDEETTEVVLMTKQLEEDEDPVHCGHCWFCAERWYAFDRII